MRLFIAVNFNDEILDSLTDFQDALKEQGVTGNYSGRENLHITLAFIGDFDDPDEVLDAMEQVEFRPFEIGLEGVGFFGDLMWVGVSHAPELTAYVKRLRHVLSERNIPYDRKKFTPHITVIRRFSCRGGKHFPVPAPPKGSMTVERISLMRSDRGKHGMIYTEIGSIQ